MAIIDTLKNLERLEALVDESSKYFGFFRFDDEEFYMLVNKIRASLPEDLRRAGKITQNSERIVEEAQTEAERQLETARAEADRYVASSRAEADRILEEAGARAKAMVENSEIVRLASAQAKDIVARAEAKAEKVTTDAEAAARSLRSDADDYAAGVLDTLESQVKETLQQVESKVNGTLSTIQRGRQKLNSPHGRPPAPASVRSSLTPRSPAVSRVGEHVATPGEGTNGTYGSNGRG